MHDNPYQLRRRKAALRRKRQREWECYDCGGQTAFGKRRCPTCLKKNVHNKPAQG